MTQTLPALRKWWPDWQRADNMGMVGQQELEAGGLEELAVEARFALRALLDEHPAKSRNAPKFEA